MAHNLMTDDNGKACMMYVQDVPWHELGTRLDAPPTAEEAIRHAKLDWTVAKQRVLVGCATGQLRFLPDVYALMPADGWTKRELPVFGLVGERYRVLQNREAFAFFDPLVRSGHAAYETAGALDEGGRVWVLARMRGAFEVGRGDRVNKYLLLANSHDGHGAVQIKVTPIRVVCQNTLSRALAGGGAIHVAHAGNMQARLKAAQHVLAWQRAVYEQLAEQYRAMARRPMDRAALGGYLRDVLPDPPPPRTHDGEDAWRQARKRLDLARRGCAALFEKESDTRRFRNAGSLWTAYNSVTEYVDHVTPARLGDPARRLHAMWFGKGDALKVRAYRRALDRLETPPRSNG